MTAFFLVVSAQDRKSFMFETDRQFFSVPVQILPEFCDIKTRQLYCRSPLQGDVTYAVNPANLKRESQLMKRQRIAARRIA